MTEAGRVRGAVTVWITIQQERKCIAGLLQIFGVSFDYGLLIMVCSLPFKLTDYPGLAISPWYRLVLGFLVIFSECNLLCSLCFNLIILFCSFYFALFFLSFCIFILLLVVKCNL